MYQTLVIIELKRCFSFNVYGEGIYQITMLLSGLVYFTGLSILIMLTAVEVNVFHFNCSYLSVIVIFMVLISEY